MILHFFTDLVKDGKIITVHNSSAQDFALAVKSVKTRSSASNPVHLFTDTLLDK